MLCESWELANITLVLGNKIKQTNKTIWEAIWPVSWTFVLGKMLGSHFKGYSKRRVTKPQLDQRKPAQTEAQEDHVMLNYSSGIL